VQESGGRGRVRREVEKMSHKLTRREFVAGTALGTLGLILRGSSPAWGEGDPKTQVVVVRDPSVITDTFEVKSKVLSRMLDDGMKALTGAKEPEECWKQFFTPDDAVGMKINVMMVPTHQELSYNVVSNLTAIGVNDEKIIIWDRDRAGRGMKGVSSRGISFGFNEESVSNIVTKETTALINMPGLKSHWLSGVAVAVKNWCGAVTNINVPDEGVAFAIHGDSCADVGMINALPPIKNKEKLIVVDALRPLFHGGPQVNPKYLWNYGGLVLGTDPVAVDTVCLKIIQGKRNEYNEGPWPLSPPPKHIAVAGEKFKLGTSDAAKIDVKVIGETEGSYI
jgi:hypothetical protein